MLSNLVFYNFIKKKSSNLNSFFCYKVFFTSNMLRFYSNISNNQIEKSQFLIYRILIPTLQSPFPNPHFVKSISK